MSESNVRRITCEELKQMMDAGEKVVIIDTREGSEYDSGHIPGAVNIYYNMFGDPQERELRLSTMPIDTLLVPYCNCADDSISARLAQELLDLRYDDDKVKVLRGGLLNWNQMAYPLKES